MYVVFCVGGAAGGLTLQLQNSPGSNSTATWSYQMFCTLWWSVTELWLFDLNVLVYKAAGHSFTIS